MDNKINIKNSLQEKYRSYFKKRYKEFGDNVKTLWGGAESQKQRFDVLLTIGDLHGKSILDVGCGFGDLYGYIRQRKEKISRYVGYDIVPEIIKVAKGKYPDISFKCMDILRSNKINEYDYVFSSGIFFLSDDLWESYMLKMVTRMYNISKLGVGVNFLSSYSSNKDGFSYYADPSTVLSLIMKNISSKVILRHDYKINDFTVFLYK